MSLYHKIEPFKGLSSLNVAPATNGGSNSGTGRFAGLQFGGGLRLDRPGEREAFLLLCICFLDMMTTLFWVMTGRATEANPVLEWTFHYHPVVFVLVKLMSFLPACYFVVRLAQRHPAFTIGLARLVSIAYLLLYFGNLFAA